MSDEIPVEELDSGPALKPILFNILALFFLILSCLCPGFSIAIYAAPYSGLNPLPPKRFDAGINLPTSTQTPLIDFPPTWTPTVTLEPSFTATPSPSREAGATLTATLQNFSDPNATQSTFPFIVEGGNPKYSASPKGCAWLGVAGTVYDGAHIPLNNLWVVVNGKLSGNTINLEVVTGSVYADQEGEFEFKLADSPILSLNSLSIQLMDGNRVPISEKIVFNTYAGCDKNLITVIFAQVNP
jgi:hypothetical protein